MRGSLSEKSFVIKGKNREHTFPCLSFATFKWNRCKHCTQWINLLESSVDIFEHLQQRRLRTSDSKLHMKSADFGAKSLLTKFRDCTPFFQRERLHKLINHFAGNCRRQLGAREWRNVCVRLVKFRDQSWRLSSANHLDCRQCRVLNECAPLRNTL